MKKFFAIAVIAVSVVACNNSGKKTESTDTTTQKTDTTTNTTPTTDTTQHNMDTTHAADSTAPKM